MLKLKNIKKSFTLGKNKIDVLKGINLHIKEGEWVALMGPSGSGKSTLLGILAGIDSPTSGTVTLDGDKISNLKESELAKTRNEKVGIVFQSFNLIPSLTAWQNVQAPLFASKNKKDINKRSQKMLTYVGLADRLKHKPNELSGGQQQRVAIARALVTEPKVLVADEPTGNLDSKTGTKILDLFSELHKELGTTMIFATHDQNIAQRADRIIKMKDGLIEK